MKKRRYIKPGIKSVAVMGPTLMMGGSDKVQKYSTGGDIMIGDSDDPDN